MTMPKQKPLGELKPNGETYNMKLRCTSIAFRCSHCLRIVTISVAGKATPASYAYAKREAEKKHTVQRCREAAAELSSHSCC